MSAILAIDQGTSSTKSFLLRSSGEFLALGALTHEQFLPAPDRVEHDAEELVGNVERLITEALAAHPDIIGIAIANQGETVIAWDRVTKRPLHRAIVWQDARTQAVLDALPEAAKALIQERSGLPLDPYFSASKLAWLIENEPAAGDALSAGTLGIGTSDAFFLDRLTEAYATDMTTASRTSLMNLATCQWDEELCRAFGVALDVLPQIRPSCGRFGMFNGAGRAVPILASVVDQQAALFGHGCRVAGDAKITFGTGTFALALTGSVPSTPAAGLVPTVAWKLGEAEAAVYAVDGGDYTASAALDWGISLGLAGDATEFCIDGDTSACQAGVFFVPALAGLAAPHWDRRAAGLWSGLRQGTTRELLRSSMLEGIAFRAAEIVEALCADGSGPISVDGGMARNGSFVAFLADCLGRPVLLRDSTDLTALGAAELGFIGAGLAPPKRAGGLDRLVEPSARSGTIRALRSEFAAAVAASRSLAR